MSFAKDFGVSGFREAVVNVKNLPPLEETFRDVLAHDEVLYRGPADKNQAAFWQAPEATAIDEVLLRPKGIEFGHTRLVQMHGVENQQIRPGGKPWESGALYDLDIRVRDIQKVTDELEDHGWTSIHVPFQYNMGAVTVKQIELIGPDRLIFALIERIAPELGPDAGFDQVSSSFNSSQLLYDHEMADHHDFYLNTLGFECFIDTVLNYEEPGENHFGLPYNVALKHRPQVYIYHPESKMEGAIETCAFPDLTGAHYGQYGSPRNRGLSVLRFPVKDIEGYAKKIQEQGCHLAQPITEMTIEPYGETRVFALQTKAGAWLEFFEEK